MDSGFYAACQGMRAQTQALEVMANNLANVNTPGYLGELTSFNSLLASAHGTLNGPLNRAVNNFNTLGDTHLDLASGNLEPTGNSLDFAIEGEGLFAVQTPGGTMYTRNGGFRVSSSGQLITATGDAVLGEQGPVTLPAGPISVSPDGAISVNGAVSGKLRIVEFSSGSQLKAEGNSLYSANAADELPSTRSSVRQGMLNAANISPVASVVNLISMQRNADMLQRALSAFYSDFNRIAADELPRV